MNKILQSVQFEPQSLIDYLKNFEILKNEYEQRVRHYTIERHTLLVMKEFEKYFSDSFSIIDKGLFRLTLALHDIGKSKAFNTGNVSQQYHYTVVLINQIKESLPFSPQDINLMISLVDNDSLGLYIQNKLSVQEARSAILKSSVKANMPVQIFFKLVSTYYQCDVSSYTADAGGLAFLEGIFEYENGKKVFNKEKNLLQFSHNIESKYVTLNKALEQ